MQALSTAPLYVRLISVLIIPLFINACSSQWKKGLTKLDQVPMAVKTVNQFKLDKRFDRYFDESIAIAILPKNARAGTGFGAAFGYGWIIKKDDILSRVAHWQFFAGANVGVQLYSQILFFKTEEALSKYKKVRLEFSGQANASFFTMAKSLTPSYSNDVAIFTFIDGGLMLEGSVGMHTYHIFSP